MLERLKDFLAGLSVVVIICLMFLLAGGIILMIGLLIPILIPIGVLIIGIFAIYLLGHCVRWTRKGKP